ncbi:hypothetical protein P7D22_03345 [Lichenihabitans sp. Uapishka_5]|uniref:hypothetical protein n=1 Tax=Lichenihabitans sp. Uapishka_5 TaxID=3037302 RepID=UPI0029E7FEE8|nr:hypothetical protein [Lichenihabitans sp. Uapishka_5]MDX7950213.1 hypothetical protein [Lichenihabitans sp. Uapishka_5]
MPLNESGRKALTHLDAALAKQPEKDGHLLSATLTGLGVFRDGIIASHRETPTDLSRLVLDRVNGVISATMAVQYPLGEVPWASLAQARGTLVGLLDSDIWA